MASTRVCSQCGETKDESEFHKAGRTKRLECGVCRNKNQYMTRYGIEYAEYERLRDEQNGRCAICKRGAVQLCVDHDHELGHVRGLLCKRCNTSLGTLGDSVESIETVLAYLKG